MLTLRHFAIFKEVSQTGNFTKAAQNLYITQSAVSHTIREIEEYTGTVIFDRLSKYVRLTSEGKLLLNEILPILSACESLDKRIGHLEKQAPINIVSSITIASFWLPNILKEFKNNFPDIPVYVKVVSALEAINTLKLGKADIAFVEGAEPYGPFVCRHFDSYGLKIVCSPEYGEYKDKISIERFCSENLLLREKGSAARDTLDSRLYLSGFTVHPIWESVNSTAILKAAKAGLGITVLPDMIVQDEISSGELIELTVDELCLRNDLIAVYHKDKHVNSAIKNLILSL